MKIFADLIIVCPAGVGIGICTKYVKTKMIAAMTPTTTMSYSENNCFPSVACFIKKAFFLSQYTCKFKSSHIR